jgi:hypothetical protein
MFSVTITDWLGYTVVSTGSLTQVGAELGVTPEHGPAKASAVNFTVPVGKPVRLNTVLMLGATSRFVVTVKLPVALTSMQPTLPSAGTWLMAICAIPSVSSSGPEHPMPDPNPHAASTSALQPAKRFKNINASPPSDRLDEPARRQGRRGVS